MDSFWNWFLSLPVRLQLAVLGAFLGAMMIGPVAQSFLGLAIGAGVGAVAGILIPLWTAWRRQRAAGAQPELLDWHTIRASAPENRRLASYLLTLPWVGIPVGYVVCLFILEDPEEALIGLTPGFIAGFGAMMAVWKLHRFDDPLADGTSDTDQDSTQRPDIR